MAGTGVCLIIAAGDGKTLNIISSDAPVIVLWGKSAQWTRRHSVDDLS
jgi:hypothetical protein